MDSGIKFKAPVAFYLFRSSGASLSMAVDALQVTAIIRKSGSNRIVLSQSANKDQRQVFESILPGLSRGVDAFLRHIRYEAGFDCVCDFPSGLKNRESLSAAFLAVLLGGMNTLLKKPLEMSALLPLLSVTVQADTTLIHPGIAASSLLGGIHFIPDEYELKPRRIYTPEGLFVSVLLGSHPNKIKLTLTQLAKNQSFSGMDAVSLSGFILALMQSDFDFLQRILRKSQPLPGKTGEVIKACSVITYQHGGLGSLVDPDRVSLIAFSDLRSTGENISMAWRDTSNDKSRLICSGKVCQTGFMVS